MFALGDKLSRERSGSERANPRKVECAIEYVDQPPNGDHHEKADNAVIYDLLASIPFFFARSHEERSVDNKEYSSGH